MIEKVKKSITYSLAITNFRDLIFIINTKKNILFYDCFINDFTFHPILCIIMYGKILFFLNGFIQCFLKLTGVNNICYNSIFNELEKTINQ